MDEALMNENALASPDNLNSMIDNVSLELFKIIDSHFYEDSLNRMVRSFVHYKQTESTIWSELTLYSYYMLGGSSPDIYHAAAQTVLIILSLDIFDDLQDQDNFEPPWMQCGPAAAMNCASGLLVAAIAGSLGKPLDSTVLKLLAAAHNGQHKDIQNAISTEEEYLQLVAEKSASLISLAVHMGYQLIENANETTARKLAECSQHIGIAAQLQNDVKNLMLIQERNDIVQRKKTLATLYLYDLSKEAFPMLSNYYDGVCGMDELVSQEKQLVDFIAASGVSEYISAVQSLYLQQADHILRTIPALQPWALRFRSITIDHFHK